MALVLFKGSLADVKDQAFGGATSGDNTLVAAVTGKKIRVLQMILVAAAQVNLYLKSSGGTVVFGDSTNKVAVAANGGFVLPFSPLGWCETASGEGLVMNLSGATACAGVIQYVTY